MQITVKIWDELYDFYGVRSWDYSAGNLWIYFIDPILPDGNSCGFIVGGIVDSSFMPHSECYNDPENLLLLK